MESSSQMITQNMKINVIQLSSQMDNNIDVVICMDENMVLNIQCYHLADDTIDIKT
jgi:hypothetical protein